MKSGAKVVPLAWILSSLAWIHEAFPASVSSFAVDAETCILPPSPVLSIRLATFTVSPNN
jgi:hypothetical protein